MGIVIGLAVLIVVGIILAITDPGDYGETIGLGMCVVFGLAFIISGVVILGVQTKGPGATAEAKTTVEWIVSLKDNPQIDQIERQNALAWVQTISKYSATNRAFRDTFLFSWFHYHEYGDIEVPSIASIPWAKPLHGIELTGPER